MSHRVYQNYLREKKLQSNKFYNRPYLGPKPLSETSATSSPVWIVTPSCPLFDKNFKSQNLRKLVENQTKFHYSTNSHSLSLVTCKYENWRPSTGNSQIMTFIPGTTVHFPPLLPLAGSQRQSGPSAYCTLHTTLNMVAHRSKFPPYLSSHGKLVYTFQYVYINFPKKNHIPDTLTL